MLDILKTEGSHLPKQVRLNQEGKSSVCGHHITPESKCDFPHKVPPKEGVAGELANLKMLHPDSHRQLHSHYVAVSAKTKAEIALLERRAGKRARCVLRGGGEGNIAFLLDDKAVLRW